MKSSSAFLLPGILLAAVLCAQTISTGSAVTSQGASSTGRTKAADAGWPREFTRNGVRVVYYQPQVDGWNNFRDLEARAAFTLTPQGGKSAVGIEEIRGHTVANLENRTVLIDNIQIVAVRFPSLPPSEADAMANLLKTNFPGKPITVSLDRLIASAQASNKNVTPVHVNTEPPPILVSTEPAILLMVPEKPVLAPIKGLTLQFVLNANWDLFFNPGDTHYYLLADKLFLQAQSLEGPWDAAKTLPADLKKLPGQGWEHVKKAAADYAAGNVRVPKVFFATKPSELIVFAGQPAYKAINGTQLSYATNTNSWVFQDAADNQVYFLVTGRWFRAPSLDGPWTYAGDNLPDDFRQIPANSDAAAVLASVPGTPEAEDAVLLAQVPVSAVVNTSEAEAKAKVNYHGEPQFVGIKGTSLSYAVNADADVIRVEGKYYLCENAIWFVSSSPTGPWKVATTVPEAIYSIPPSSPVYHVTYVKVDSTPEGKVVCSYTAGYSGAYVAGAAAGAALVWGTGYYYPPYVYPGPVPVYRPYYATYGVSAAYYPNAGVYAVGGYGYGPYASAGRAAWYNPNTGAYGHAYTQQYPYGGQTSAWGYNPSTDTSWTTQQGHGYYAQWGSSTVTRGDQTVQTGHVVTDYGSTGVAKGENNLYAGHDGNVYRRDDNGDWSKWDNGQWQPVNTSGTTNQANRNNQSGNVGGTRQQGNSQNLQTGGSQNLQTSGGNASGRTRQGSEPGNPAATPGQGNRQNRGEQTARNGGQQGNPSSANELGTTGPATEPSPHSGRSAQEQREQSRQSGGTQRNRTESKSSSDNVVGRLDQEASARRRGSEYASQQGRSEGRNARSGRLGSEHETRNSRGRGRLRE